MRSIAPLALAGAAALLGCEPDPRTEIPTATVVRASPPPTIDGKLDDAVWKRAAKTEKFVNTMNGKPAAIDVTAQLARDDDNLYVLFSVEDDYLRCTLSGHDAHLWEQDAVELMIDPDGDGKNYFELQLSPTELVFDTRFDSRRQPQPFGHVSWKSDLRGKVQAHGTPNDTDEDGGYFAEIAIPFAALKRGHPSGAAPKAGDTWRLALYVMDAQPKGQRAAGWSPPLKPDFHVPERFGKITFAK